MVSAISAIPGSPRRVPTGPSCTSPPRASQGSSAWTNTVSPKVAAYSRMLGMKLPWSRSFWMRSTITTSAPSSASRRELPALTPSDSMAGGIIVGGAATRTSAPILRKP